MVSLLQSNMLSCYAMLSYVYIDFCKKGSVKTTKYGVFACSDHMHVLYVEITRILLRQIDFKLVSIVECFRRRGVWKQVKVVQIPMTKADLFLGIFEAIPRTLKCFEDFFVCWEAHEVSSNQHEVLTAWLMLLSTWRNLQSISKFQELLQIFRETNRL